VVAALSKYICFIKYTLNFALKVVRIKLFTMSDVLKTYLLIFVSTYKITMRKLIFIFCISVFLTSCNDGDIITVDLDFDDTFSYCGELVFYKTKSDPAESLSLKLTSPVTTIEDLIDVDPDGTKITEFTLNGTSNVFNYRSYNNNPNNVFCNDIPANVTIISDSQSDDGSVVVNSLLTEDDNDGIPAELEDINENGDLDDDDTDGDGLPNYLDDDDDGDNVSTAIENPNYSASDLLTNAQDSDADTIPDYLDTDDDGDGVLTRDEENETQDQNPTNDITDNTIGPDYLNDQVSIETPATAFRIHTIKQTFTISAVVSDFSFPNLNQDELDFGILDPSPTTERTITPDFN